VLGVGTAFVYFVAPNRERPHWQWVSPGSLLATILLLAASGLFSVYVGHWGSYNETYGSLAAVAMLLLWLYIAGLVFLLGAELNAEVEREAGA
jgi:membrane protein